MHGNDLQSINACPPQLHFVNPNPRGLRDEERERRRCSPGCSSRSPPPRRRRRCGRSRTWHEMTDFDCWRENESEVSVSPIPLLSLATAAKSQINQKTGENEISMHVDGTRTPHKEECVPLSC